MIIFITNSISLVRVSDVDTLLTGAPKAPYSPGHYCQCSSSEAPGNRTCNRNALVDTSNINTGMHMVSLLSRGRGTSM